ncbi:hypothetical protein [Streptomyces sp. NPDC045369]|uniref:hypothetical protein n=1 Tax=Streptomyces sp. NPDC045369 TaxID=3155732 RepID=UPI003411E02D
MADLNGEVRHFWSNLSVESFSYLCPPSRQVGFCWVGQLPLLLIHSDDPDYFLTLSAVGVAGQLPGL